MAVKNLVQLRRGTAAEWTSANPTLSVGEIGVETDTLQFKIGDGSAAWTSLAYSTDWSKLENVPSTFTPSAHTHVMADITDYTPPGLENHFMLMGS